ncbi:MAG: ornithine carbamoyltransferase [Nanoarchaeota archaeon]
MNLINLKDLSKKDILSLIDKSLDIKKNPNNYKNKLVGKSMLMIFEKPSLRTRVSFEVAMTQMGGHAIYGDVGTLPLGDKESVPDTAKTASRYCNIIIARVFDHNDIVELGKYSDVPVINALTNSSHPCQILADLLTIKEKIGNLNIKLAFFGDGDNNITHSLMYAAAILGFDIAVACPKQHMPNKKVTKDCINIAKNTGAKITITQKPLEAATNSDVIYTDSWMSYHIPKTQSKKRVKTFKPFQVNQKVMKIAKKNAIFMNCLPAMRGYEQTAEVIDGPKSVVFDQAENRLHMQKAIILKLMNIR